MAQYKVQVVYPAYTPRASSIFAEPAIILSHMYSSTEYDQSWIITRAARDRNVAVQRAHTYDVFRRIIIQETGLET